MKIAQAMVPTETFVHKNLIQTSEAITKRTGGKITWTIFGPEIGDWTELEIMNKMGTVDYVWNAHTSGFDPRWNMIGMPFVASDMEGAMKFVGPDGVFMQLGKDFAADGGVYELAFHLTGIGMICLNYDPVMTPEQAAGVKLRVWPQETPKCYVAKMGFTPVTIPWAEAATAVSTGIVDGLVGASSYYHWLVFRDIARTQIRTFDFLDCWDMTWNLEGWNRLPEEYQKIIQEESTAAAKRQHDNVWAEEMEYVQKLRDIGWEVIDMAEDYPDELAVWQKLARECWDDFEPIMGKMYVDRIREAVAEIEAAR